MPSYVEKLNANHQDGAFMKAVLAIHNNKFDEAQDYINKVFLQTFR